MDQAETAALAKKVQAAAKLAATGIDRERAPIGAPTLRYRDGGGRKAGESAPTT